MAVDVQRGFAPDLTATLVSAQEIQKMEAEQYVNRAIGSRVRERRHAQGLTLKSVSGLTGLSVSLISQIELGKSAASVHTLYKISGALEVPMTYFFESVRS